MSLPRQLPTPVIPKADAPLVGYFRELHERLRAWTTQASTELERMVLAPTQLNEIVDGSRTAFTPPIPIDTLQSSDGAATAKAQMVADGKVIPYSVADPPAAGFWTLRQVDLTHQVIVLGTAPVTDCHLGFLVARLV